ncbi:BLUF domain-containing protein [Ramlibacter monticola]|uniref:BLUF domain-containing protein n=1 Tax=Ramlibacter monticola TaxID=1926872 RepID=A0A937CWG7_9BURK|nr:BLUF domain-containing protein [Ramlibacter monticola]MBL0394459.1 BLUF domain-containing protein [Ramlibacter monticola]
MDLDDAGMDGWEAQHGLDSAEGPVARIMYASQASIRQSVYQEMEKIRASALKHNEPAGIATALLHQSGWFVQWKEGPAPALQDIMERVAGDLRHFDLRIVHRSRGPRLLSGPWSMAIAQCRETSAEMEMRVRQLKQQVDDGMQFSPAAVWRRLSTPMQHPGAMRQQDPDAFQRVLVCAAHGMGSFELVRWLGERHCVEIVHRRFAGAIELDVGTDYVDFEQEGRVWRVIAMARHGLHLPLTRAFIPDYSHVVLLLSIDPERNSQLMERVTRAFQGVRHPPALIGVASRPEMHALPASLARQHGLPYLTAVADSRDPHATWRAVQPPLLLWQQAANSSICSGINPMVVGQ